MKLSEFWRKLVSSSQPEEYLITQRAERVLELAKSEAAKTSQQIPTITHLAVALLNFNEGVAFAVLKHLRIDRDEILQACLSQPISTPLEELLPIADIERRGLCHVYLGTEHLFLALLRHGENPLARQLGAQGIDPVIARQEILKTLDPNFEAEA
jgi:ATP-dependent Clp protease ATP-binding subunit ClpC